MMKLAAYAVTLSLIYAVVAVVEPRAAEASTVAFIAAILLPALYDVRCMHRHRKARQ